MDLNLVLGAKKDQILKNKILLIGIAIGFISFWFGYNKIFRTAMTSMQAIKAGIQSESLKADVLKRLEVLQKGVEGYKHYFAKQTDVLWLVDRVSGLAKESGLEIISLKPQPVVSRRNFLYCNVNVTTKGTFHQLGDFVSSIEGSDEFMWIEKLSFKKDKEALNAEVIISTYFWKGQ